MGIWSPGPGATGGNDTFEGNGADEAADGLAGNDILYGRGGGDTLTGGAGNDIIRPGDDYFADILNGGADYDVLDYSELTEDGVLIGGTWAFRGSAIDSFSNFEEFIGSSTHDAIDTSAVNGAVLRGGDGNDILSVSGQTNNPALYGGAGRDHFFIFNADMRIMDFQVGIDWFHGPDTIASMTIDGADTVLTTGLGFDIRIVGINSLTLTEWRAHITAGTNFNSSSFSEDNYTGTSHADWAAGGSRNDVLSGLGGDDTLSGGTGDDTLSGGSGNDEIEGGSENDQITGGDGDDRIAGGSGADTLRGGIGVDYVDGGSGDDVIQAAQGEAGAGDSYLGGDGVDTIRLVTPNFYDTVDLRSATISGIERIQFDTGDTMSWVSINASQIGGALPSDLHLIGSNHSDGVAVYMDVPGSLDLSGWTFSNWNTLFQYLDYVRIFGSSSADIITAPDSPTWFDGEGGNDIFHGSARNDFVRAGAGADIAYGNGGNDTFIVFSGELDAGDEMHGGDGNDLLSLGFLTVADFRGLTISSIESLELGGTAIFNASDFGTKIAINASVYSGTTSGILTIYMDVANTFTNAFNYGGWSGVTQIIGTGSVDTINGSAFMDELSGQGGNDTLNGGAGSDRLDGGLGADAMNGGDGDDIYVVDNAGDVATETALGGVDTIESSLTRTLNANVENLTLTGASAINGFGNALNNVITGNGAANQLNGFDGNDTLDGGAGADAMFGGNGDDIYIVDDAGDVTSEVSALGGTDTVISSVNRNLTAHIENLTLDGSANLTGAGNTLNNVITGNTGANTLYGFDGNDTLDGGAGADTLFGANGDDTYVVDDVGDITVEGSPSGGIDTVLSSIDRNLNANFENLTLTGTAQYGYGNVLNNVMMGNASSNSLYGFDGNDTIDGGVGADFMYGGNGDDTYIVDNAGDVTSEASPSGGIDTVISSVTRNLTANIENLTLSGTANTTGAGNALNNAITGNSGANTLYGLDGADTLDGGLGADTLQGGTGADNYVFSTTLSGGNVDAIVGFSAVDDTIVLSNAIFAGLSLGTLTASAFVIGAAAADASDRIIYNSTTGALLYDVDGNGGIAAVQFATLATGLALTNSDFIVSGP